MARGYLAIVLHAHLPFVRHPEDPTVMEEQLALRGDHRHLPAAAAGVRGAASPTASPTAVTVSLSAPLISDADRRPAQGAVRRTPRRA